MQKRLFLFPQIQIQSWKDNKNFCLEETKIKIQISMILWIYLEYAELGEKHKDHWVQLQALHRIIQKSPYVPGKKQMGSNHTNVKENSPLITVPEKILL